MATLCQKFSHHNQYNVAYMMSTYLRSVKRNLKFKTFSTNSRNMKEMCNKNIIEL